MSDELETAGKVGSGALGATGVLGILWAAFVRRANRNEEKVEKTSEARLVHCEKALEAHRELIATLSSKVVELDTRLKFREGAYGTEPLTSPGVRPTPALDAFRAEMARRKTEEEEGGNG